MKNQKTPGPECPACPHFREGANQWNRPAKCWVLRAFVSPCPAVARAKRYQTNPPVNRLDLWTGESA